MTAATQGEGGRAGGLRFARGLLIVAAILLLLPYMVAPLYRFVDPVSTVMLARWLTGRHVEHSYMPIERLSPALPLAVLTAEDERFCSHHGVDWGEIGAALKEADDDITAARGGSTITQQTVKNLFLWPGRSFIRKALELPLALWIDLVLPKRRIMEIYLNIAEWGPHGEFGAEAAARAAFGKSRCSTSTRPRSWRRSCPIRNSVARVGRGRPCAGSRASVRHARAARQHLRLASEPEPPSALPGDPLYQRPPGH
jgi:monofunctional glycosyltransferase